MTAANRNPLANPFTDRPIGNVNWQKLDRGGYFRKASKDCSLPDPNVAYQDLLAQEAEELHVPQQAEPIFSSLDMRSYGQVHNDKASFIAVEPSSPFSLSRQDIEWKARCDEENAKLSASLSDEQKSMLNNIEQFVGKSNFEDENS